jgi:hypothetical protein
MLSSFIFSERFGLTGIPLSEKYKENFHHWHWKRTTNTDTDRSKLTSYFPLFSENRELIYWAVGLLHEFVALDIALPEICAVPILLRSLYSVLISSEANIQRLVLRVLRFLCESSDDFKAKTVHNKHLLARLPICLASGDRDVTSWSLYLIHDIAKSGMQHLIIWL